VNALDNGAYLPPNIGYVKDVSAHDHYIAMIIGAFLSKGKARVSIFGN
jgi:hypothetical protein